MKEHKTERKKQCIKIIKKTKSTERGSSFLHFTLIHIKFGRLYFTDKEFVAKLFLIALKTKQNLFQAKFKTSMVWYENTDALS